MPTTPLGIVSPDGANNYDLTVHLGAMAVSIDTAIQKHGNVQKGTASQRAAAGTAAVNGSLWVDTDGAKMLWRRDSTVSGNWAPAVGSWFGTTAQMNAVTTSPVGFRWFNTTDNLEYVRTASAWKVRMWDQSGRTSIPGGNSGNVSGFYWGPTATINFPTPFPVGTIPVVTANIVHAAFQGYFATISDVTNTSFKATVLRMGGAPATGDLHWRALVV